MTGISATNSVIASADHMASQNVAGRGVTAKRDRARARRGEPSRTGIALRAVMGEILQLAGPQNIRVSPYTWA